MRVISPVSSTLGVLICECDGYNRPFAEQQFLKQLCQYGSSFGLEVCIFDPNTWDEENKKIKGWTWDNTKRRWHNTPRPLPVLLYDRSWPQTDDERYKFRQAVTRLQSICSLTFMNSHMPHKGKVIALLSRDAYLRHLVPPTIPFNGPLSITRFLVDHGPSLFLKPAIGSQGKRVVALFANPQGQAKLSGRTSNNVSFVRNYANTDDAIERLQRWIGSRHYLIQPNLELRNAVGEPFDLRVLMQKNEKAQWSLTGIAARCGDVHTVTANLHGGGRARPATEVLTEMLGNVRASALLLEVRQHAFDLVKKLEQSLGRFAELGLDFGIDHRGKCWFLEANSKPGRTSLRALGRHAARAAITSPLAYASSILLRKPGRVIHESNRL
ncbi:MAG: YheC/YheD family protein [Candidatus Cohnella colombiensis]|uniref:YheC/YheD family protein n=1 Tax=Candidatus Cohnella colombiensis TaxID=3121368 RepID=A0AA95JDT2_9BACL|nr:MAG: YheC/YheD family protein [Cohnella sp.]